MGNVVDLYLVHGPSAGLQVAEQIHISVFNHPGHVSCAAARSIIHPYLPIRLADLIVHNVSKLPVLTAVPGKAVCGVAGVICGFVKVVDPVGNHEFDSIPKGQGFNQDDANVPAHSQNPIRCNPVGHPRGRPYGFNRKPVDRFQVRVGNRCITNEERFLAGIVIDHSGEVAFLRIAEVDEHLLAFLVERVRNAAVIEVVSRSENLFFFDCCQLLLNDIPVFKD